AASANMKSSLLNPLVVEDYLARDREVSLGRVTGPFNSYHHLSFPAACQQIWRHSEARPTWEMEAHCGPVAPGGRQRRRRHQWGRFLSLSYSRVDDAIDFIMQERRHPRCLPSNPSPSTISLPPRHGLEQLAVRGPGSPVLSALGLLYLQSIRRRLVLDPAP
ncbi:hypothetical protein OS493_010720, partial [Desmophyllum pertusum]